MYALCLALSGSVPHVVPNVRLDSAVQAMLQKFFGARVEVRIENSFSHVAQVVIVCVVGFTRDAPEHVTEQNRMVPLPFFILFFSRYDDMQKVTPQCSQTWLTTSARFRTPDSHLNEFEQACEQKSRTLHLNE
jgi:hypothetical protein